MGYTRFRLHLIPLLCGAVAFFGLNLMSVFIQGRGDSLGNNTDSIYHYTKILRVRNCLAPNPSIDLDSRLPTDDRLYQLVSTLTDRTGLPLISVLQIIWVIYSLLFVVGCYALAVNMTGNPWAGAFMAASGWGFTLAIGGHWGWDYSPIVPHDLATSFIPWLMIIWTRVRSRAAFAGLLAGIGIMAQIYPTTFVHFAALVLCAQFLMNPRDVKTVLAGVAMFTLAILPLGYAWSKGGPIPEEFMPLFKERQAYLAPGRMVVLLTAYKLFFIQCGLLIFASVLLRHTASPPGWRKVRALGWAGLLSAVIGQWTFHLPLLAPLFVSRASRLTYLWILLSQARTLAGPRGRVQRIMGIGICLISLTLRPNLAGPARLFLHGEDLRVAIDAYHIQDTSEFRELCSVVASTTEREALILTPPDDRYLFLRAYAQRPVACLNKELGIAAYTRAPALLDEWALVKMTRQAYHDQDLAAVLDIASAQQCAALVFPPEWPQPSHADFGNSAGWLLIVDNGTTNDPIVDTPG